MLDTTQWTKPEGLRELVRLYRAATPGKWLGSHPKEGSLCVWHLDSGGCIFEVGDPYPRGDNHPSENIELVVAIHSALPQLIGALAPELLEELTRPKPGAPPKERQEAFASLVDTMKAVPVGRYQCS